MTEGQWFEAAELCREFLGIAINESQVADLQSSDNVRGSDNVGNSSSST
jgi:hypothetical protein